jgi:eukaryotic-like serine/threonine-protein kinase
MKRNTTAEIDKPAWKDTQEPEEGNNWLTPFRSELEPVALAPALAPAPDRPRSSRRRIPFVVIGVCASLAAGGIAWQTWTVMPAASAPLNAVAATGTADFKSVPDGASITIDGTVRGVTPLRVALAAGSHTVQITSGSVSRTLPITVEPGAVVSQYVELATAPPTTGGRLEIGSDPPGAQIALDGVSRGVTPLVLADVAPGQHRVTVSAGGNTVVRTVNVTRGAASTLVVSTAPLAAGASGGWLTTQAPVDMDILEDGRVLGSTRMERLMLPVGTHRIEFSNPALEFAVARTVQIAAGRTASVAITLPSGRLSVNAVPWADVSLNGASLGTTPLGELAVPIGTHELVFRHPQLGERRQMVTVKAQTPARIGIDLRK